MSSWPQESASIKPRTCRFYRWYAGVRLEIVLLAADWSARCACHRLDSFFVERRNLRQETGHPKIRLPQSARETADVSRGAPVWHDRDSAEKWHARARMLLQQEEESASRQEPMDDRQLDSAPTRRQLLSLISKLQEVLI